MDCPEGATPSGRSPGRSVGVLTALEWMICAQFAWLRTIVRWPAQRCPALGQLLSRGAGRASGELVGEVPGTQITRFEANEQVVAGAVGICGSGLTAKVARRDSLHYVLDSCGEELGAAAELDSAVRRGVLAHHDACSGISPQLRRLHIAAASDDVEAAVAPFVPDRRQQHGAVWPMGGQNRQQTEFDQIPEIVHSQVPAHASRLTGGGRLDQPTLIRSRYGSVACTPRVPHVSTCRSLRRLRRSWCGRGDGRQWSRSVAARCWRPAPGTA